MIEIPQFVRDLIDLRCSTSAKLRPSAWFIGQHPELGPFLDALVSSEPWYRCREDALKLLCLGFVEPARCLRCGRELDQDRLMKNSALRFCSKRCSQSSPERLAKVRATSLARFGVENAMQSDAIKERNAATNLARYGVANVFQSEAIKEKSRTTMLEKYGAENFSQTDGFAAKFRETMLERYGAEHPYASEEIREKIQSTNRERYGGIAPACSHDVVEKMKATCRERYGADSSLCSPAVNAKRQATWARNYGGNPSSDPEIKRKRRETNRRKFGSETYYTSFEYLSREYEKLKAKFAGKVAPLFTAEEFHGANCREEYRWRCERCGAEFASSIYTTSFDPEIPVLPRCLKCFPMLTGESVSENRLLDFVRDVYHGKVLHGDRTVIRPLELDIYLPEKALAIEYDGTYWHSTAAGKDAGYHLRKTERCERAGVRLIHVFEDEWRAHREIVEDRIRSAMGMCSRRIHARECEVREVPAAEANAFLRRTHLQGGDRSPVRLGLFHRGALVAVMTFGRPRFSRGFDWELVRFSTELGTRVAGGASRLLAHFRKSHAGSVVSYADRRWSVGGLYAALGFRLVGTSRPNYWYVRGTEKHSRYECQKHKLPALLGDAFDPSKSESENMSLAGFDRIYDCGNLVYVLEEEREAR